MDKYISFELSQSDAAKSEFSNYSLGDTMLLPYYFKNSALINIFLGENNSGKSRFMREIMKSNPIRIIESSIDLNDFMSVTWHLNHIAADPEFAGFNKIVFISNDTSRLTKQLKDILTNDSRLDDSITIEINPVDIILELSKFVESTFAAASTIREVLDITLSKKQEYFEEIKEYIFRLNRANDFYGCFVEPNYYGLHAHSYYRNSVQFDGNSCSLKVEGLYDAISYDEVSLRRKLAQSLTSSLNEIIKWCEKLIEMLSPIALSKISTTKRSYIPTLRTARTFIDEKHKRLLSSMNVMKYATVRDYDLDDSQVEIITGFELYDAILGKYAARNTKRGDLISFQNFLSEAFFNGQRVEIVPERVEDSRGGNILVTVGTQERDIHHLGDGIQAIILLLYPLFFAKKGEWFFIEEPETHLHPGFQRLFIKTITKNQSLLDKELTVFMTTHSNHILDFAIDEAKSINLFTFRKTQEENEKSAYQIQLTKQGDLESLNVLGVQNSSVFLSNCTIWLEGVTDRIYLAAYLKVYLTHHKSKFSLIEGLHYSFLEYAGSNVMHYDFEAHAHDSSITPEALKDIQALSISNRILLIADQDGGKKTRRDEQLSGQQHAGFEYQILPVREIENLLSKEVITAALQKMYPDKTFDAALLDVADYKDEYLGKYLRSKYPTLPDNFAPADGSGTIGSTKKRRFAECAAEALTSWADMTPEAQQLTEQVYQFIVGHNPRLTSN